MERREFLKTSCGFCTAFTVTSLFGSLLAGCKPSELFYKTQAVDGKITVPPEIFAEQKYRIIRTPQLPFDLLLVKNSAASYHTLAMQCTHNQQPLVVTSKGLVCNEHGSKFDHDGNVVRDPATKPLVKFRTELISDSIIIFLSKN
jgi:Rieske Fe-S protein